MAFIFYDTETTGLETAFDRILQFAAIKTDDDLNELGRFDIRCRLMPHIVPSPGVLRVTGLPFSEPGSAKLDDPICSAMRAVVKSSKGKASCIRMTEEGSPEIAGVNGHG